MTGAEIRSAFDRIAGTDFGMSEPRWSSRFLSEHRQARHYRAGRASIAEDAAHVHSSLGGRFRRLRLAIGRRLTGNGIAYPPRERSIHGRGSECRRCRRPRGRSVNCCADGRFALVSVAGTPGADAIGARWSDRVRTVHVAPDAVAGLPAVVLVRPDGYVAWASDAVTGDDVAAAVQTWCGPATFA